MCKKAFCGYFEKEICVPNQRTNVRFPTLENKMDHKLRNSLINLFYIFIYAAMKSLPLVLV